MKKSIIFCLAVVIIGSLWLTVTAQAPVESILAQARQAAQRYPHADAVCLVNEDDVRIDPDGTVHDTVHRAYLILNRAGVRDYSYITFLYLPPYQKIRLDYARTITPDGKQIVPDAHTIMDKQAGDWEDYTPQEVEKGGPLHDFSVYMPNVTKGAVIDFQATITSAPTPRKFSVWYLAGEEPRVEERYVVSVPRGMPFRWAVTGMDLHPAVQTGSDTVTYTFRVHDVSGIPHEPGMPAVSTLSPALFASTIESWDAVIRRFAAEIANAVRPDPAITREANDLTEGCTTRKMKIDNIYKFVADDISYSSNKHLHPFPAAITYFVGYGDCKDQAVLLIALLKAVGIDAYPVLLNANVGVDIDLSLPPNFQQFNHVIVAVPVEGGWWFLDPSNGVGYTPSYLPPQDAEKHAVVILGEPDREWVEVVTPKSSAEATVANANARMNVDEDGNITLQATSKLTGEKGHWVRILGGYPYNKVRNYYQRIIDKAYPGAKIVSLSAYNPLNPDVFPVPFSVTIRADKAVDTTGDSFTLTVPYPPPLTDFVTNLPDLNPAQRRYPYFITPERIEVSTRIELPHGWRAILPGGVHVENEIGSFSSSYHMETTSASAPAACSCDRTLVLNVMKVPLDKIALLKQIFDAIKQDEAAKIIVHRKTASDQ